LEAEKLETSIQAYVVVLQPVARRGRTYRRSQGHVGRFPPNVFTWGKLPENNDATLGKILKMGIS
jgi:hypothetical protein